MRRYMLVVKATPEIEAGTFPDEAFELEAARYIGELEKAGALGEHSLSGAVVNPRAFQELFPDLKPGDFPFRQAVEGEAVYFLSREGSFKLPTPPTMRNHSYYTASLSEMVRWLGEQAEALGVNLFPGFPVESLLVDGPVVRGVRTTASGVPVWAKALLTGLKFSGRTSSGR